MVHRRHGGRVVRRRVRPDHSDSRARTRYGAMPQVASQEHLTRVLGGGLVVPPHAAATAVVLNVTATDTPRARGLHALAERHAAPAGRQPQCNDRRPDHPERSDRDVGVRSDRRVHPVRCAPRAGPLRLLPARLTTAVSRPAGRPLMQTSLVEPPHRPLKGRLRTANRTLSAPTSP